MSSNVKMIKPTIFQFHKGTIRTLVDKFFHAIGYNFNSIKVQLELPEEEG